MAVVLAGCASTVQVRSTASVLPDGFGSDNGSTAQASDLPGGASPQAARPGTSRALGTTTAGTTGGALPGQSPTTSAGAGASLPGALRNHDPVKFGVIYTPTLQGSGAADAIGVAGFTTGDTAAEAKAMADWVNAHGGMGGHPIQLVKVADDTPGTADQSAAAVCSSLGEDNHVRYAVTIIGIAPAPSFLPCLARYGIGLLDDETSLDDQTMAKYSDFLANSGELAAGRRQTVMVEDLWKRGWLTAGSKIGILADDGNGARAVVNGPLTAALARHGLRSLSTEYIDAGGSGDGGNAQSRSAALQFATLHVDRVLNVMYSPLYFMTAAQSQQYYPAYAVNSDVAPGALLETAAPGQLRNAVGIGWAPYNDIGKGTPPGPVSKRETQCFDIMRKAGLQMTSPLVRAFAVQICNSFFYLKDLGDRVPTVPRNLFAAGRALLGQAFLSADTFRVDVTHHTDGVAGYRQLAFEQDCQCFQYVSPVKSTS